MTTPEERFWARVCKDEPNGCWVWTGSVDTRGYGMTHTLTSELRMIRAYRLSYQLLVGPVPVGLELDHLCKNRRCCNPAHLEAVTHAVNTRRSDNPLARNARKTHCKHGHEFTPENTLMRSWGGRECRECRRLTSHAYNDRRHLNGPGKGGWQRAKTHCPHGHEYSAENTYISPHGYRKCRQCIQIHEATRHR